MPDVRRARLYKPAKPQATPKPTALPFPHTMQVWGEHCLGVSNSEACHADPKSNHSIIHPRGRGVCRR